MPKPTKIELLTQRMSLPSSTAEKIAKKLTLQAINNHLTHTQNFLSQQWLTPEMREIATQIAQSHLQNRQEPISNTFQALNNFSQAHPDPEVRLQGFHFALLATELNQDPSHGLHKASQTLAQIQQNANYIIQASLAEQNAQKHRKLLERAQYLSRQEQPPLETKLTQEQLAAEVNIFNRRQEKLEKILEEGIRNGEITRNTARETILRLSKEFIERLDKTPEQRINAIAKGRLELSDPQKAVALKEIAHMALEEQARALLKKEALKLRKPRRNPKKT